jgi:hypothetical protein
MGDTIQVDLETLLATFKTFIAFLDKIRFFHTSVLDDCFSRFNHKNEFMGLLQTFTEGVSHITGISPFEMDKHFPPSSSSVSADGDAAVAVAAAGDAGASADASAGASGGASGGEGEKLLSALDRRAERELNRRLKEADEEDSAGEADEAGAEKGKKKGGVKKGGVKKGGGKSKKDEEKKKKKSMRAAITCLVDNPMSVWFRVRTNLIEAAARSQQLLREGRIETSEFCLSHMPLRELESMQERDLLERDRQLRGHCRTIDALYLNTYAQRGAVWYVISYRWRRQRMIGGRMNSDRVKEWACYCEANAGAYPPVINQWICFYEMVCRHPYLIHAGVGLARLVRFKRFILKNLEDEDVVPPDCPLRTATGTMIAKVKMDSVRGETDEKFFKSITDILSNSKKELEALLKDPTYVDGDENAIENIDDDDCEMVDVK